MQYWQADFGARLAGISGSVKGTKRKEKEPRKCVFSEGTHKGTNTRSQGFQRCTDIHSLEYKHFRVIGPLHSRNHHPHSWHITLPWPISGQIREGGRAGMEGNRGGPSHPIPKFLQKLFPSHTHLLE